VAKLHKRPCTRHDLIDTARPYIYPRASIKLSSAAEIVVRLAIAQRVGAKAGMHLFDLRARVFEVENKHHRFVISTESDARFKCTSLSFILLNIAQQQRVFAVQIGGIRRI
jgi:hypothetical protein